jgi:hypothetical protein
VKRRLFNVATAVSLLLSITTLVLWERGSRLPVRYWRQTYQPQSAVYGQYAVDNLNGVMAVLYFRAKITDPSAIAICEQAAPRYRWSTLKWVPLTQPTHRLENFGIYCQAHRATGLNYGDPQAMYYYFGAPHWLIALLLAILPAIWTVRKATRLRRAIRNCCTACGYNLRGNTSGICPECGAPVYQSVKATPKI